MEREIIAQRSAQLESPVTLELVDALKPLGEALPDQLPLRYLKLSFEQAQYKRKERDARLKREQLLEPVRAWEQGTSELPPQFKQHLTASIDAFLRSYETYEYHEFNSATVRTVRQATREDLEGRRQIGKLRAALLKEVFGDKSLESTGGK